MEADTGRRPAGRSWVSRSILLVEANESPTVPQLPPPPYPATNQSSRLQEFNTTGPHPVSGVEGPFVGVREVGDGRSPLKSSGSSGFGVGRSSVSSFDSDLGLSLNSDNCHSISTVSTIRVGQG